MAAQERSAHRPIDERHVRDRLIEAAEVLFCDRGFNETSVRDIAAAADCNVASVNYYFGGKDNLYVEVWHRRLAAMRDMRLAGIEKVMSGEMLPELETLLRVYAQSFIEPLVDDGHSCRFVHLMAREMIDPHLPEDMFLNEMIEPVMTVLAQALMKVCPWLEDRSVRQVILSVVGQLMHMVCAVGMFEHSSHPELSTLDFGQMVEHVVKFSAAGIRAYADGRGQCA